ncbi:MAG: hypothetical protein ABIE22_03575 [archaeon]
MKRIILTLLLGIFLASVVSAVGVTFPQPQNMELRPGENNYFIFQIQSDHFPIICIPEIESSDNLQIILEDNYTVAQNQRFNVQGEVVLSKGASFGDYKTTFCILCMPLESEGSTVNIKTCGLPVTVSAVAQRSGPNLYEPPSPSYLIPVIVILSIAIIILLAIIIIYLYRKRKR